LHIIAVSINHHTAPVEFREKFAIPDDRLPEALHRLRQLNSILEGVIVSTCNRMEIYAVVDRLFVCAHHLREFLESWFGVPRMDFVNHIQIFEDWDAVRHLFRVTCGLESMIIGETQILGQIRDAFLLAQKEKATGTMFNTLFKQAVTLAKRAHTETNISDNPVSVSYAAVELGKRILGDYRHKNIMIIGAGKMGELTFKHLSTAGVGRVVVANRTIAKAEELAREWNGIACRIEEVPAKLAEHDIDIVISSTGSQHYVLTRSQVEPLMEKRPERPLFLIDIAVPRDLDPAIAGIGNVHLYDIDDLSSIVESNMRLRERESAKVEAMIEAEIEAFRQWYNMQEVVPVIRALQEKADAIHRETMESLMRKLPDLSERELKVIRKLSKSIVNQLLHEPILRIKEMAAGQHGKEALEMFTHFFALEERLGRETRAAAELSSSREFRDMIDRKIAAEMAKTFSVPTQLKVSAHG